MSWTRQCLQRLVMIGPEKSEHQGDSAMSELVGGKVVEVRSFGTSMGDEDAYVEVVLQDGNTYAIAFDEHIANQFAMAVLAASNHLLSKIAARRPPGSTIIPGQPIPLSSGSATVAQYGPDKVVVLDMKTDQGLSLMFSMSPRSADLFAKRLTNRRMAERLEPPKKTLQ